MFGSRADDRAAPKSRYRVPAVARSLPWRRATAVSGSARHRRGAHRRRITKVLNCIATISVNGPLRTKLRAIADAGFEHVEIFESDLLASPESVPVIGAMMRDLGLTCVAFQPFRDFEGMPVAERKRVFDRAERKFDVLQELGTDLMLVSSNVSPAALADRGRIVDDFRELGDRAAARGLRVAFEALAWGRHVRDHRDAWDIVRQADHTSVGLALDAFSS